MVVRKLLLALMLLSSVIAFGQDSVRKERSPAGFSDATPHALKVRNIYSFSPMQLLENTYGFGLSLEHFIGAARNTSICLPLFATYYSSDGGYTKRKDQMTFFNPELKIYLTQPEKNVKFAIGPSLVAGYGQTLARSDYFTNAQKSVDKLVLGAMVNGSMNIFPFAHVYYGIDFGCGFTYVNKIDNNELGSKMLVHAGLKIGYML